MSQDKPRRQQRVALLWQHLGLMTGEETCDCVAATFSTLSAKHAKYGPARFHGTEAAVQLALQCTVTERLCQYTQGALPRLPPNIPTVFRACQAAMRVKYKCCALETHDIHTRLKLHIITRPQPFDKHGQNSCPLQTHTIKAVKWWAYGSPVDGMMAHHTHDHLALCES